MTSFAHMKLDFYDDPNIINGLEIPKFVRETPIRAKASLNKLGSDSFALVIITPDEEIHPKFPIHTPGDTWLSLLAFEKNAHKMPLVMQETAAKFINTAADAWGLDYDNELFKKVATQNTSKQSNIVHVSSSDFEELLSVKQASDKNNAMLENLSNEWFGLVIDEDTRLYPLYTKDGLHKAAALFNESYQELEPKYRKEFADKIVWAAGKHAEVIDSSVVRKYASNRFSDELDYVVQSRKTYCIDADDIHLLDDLLEKKASNAITPTEFAKVLETLDRKIGLDAYWDRDLLDPYASVFSTPKLADYSYNDSDVDVSGNQLRSFVKSKDYREKLQAYMSKEIVDELERNPVEIFESLPKPEKRLLVDLMKER